MYIEQEYIQYICGHEGNKEEDFIFGVFWRDEKEL